jgi:lipopolysaccharide transport system ATP-binding protein
VGVSVSDESGRVCLEVSTAGGAGLGSAVPGRGEVLLELYRVDLRAGAYFVDVGLYERNWEYAYDYHWHAYPLAVMPHERAKPGHREAPHRWSMRSLDGDD